MHCVLGGILSREKYRITVISEDRKQELGLPCFLVCDSSFHHPQQCLSEDVLLLHHKLEMNQSLHRLNHHVKLKMWNLLCLASTSKQLCGSESTNSNGILGLKVQSAEQGKGIKIQGG